MAESILEQALETLQDNLEAINGDDGTTYWYTPDAVWVVPFFEDRHLDDSVGDPAHIILIRPDIEYHEEYATQTARGTCDVFILLARKFEPSTELPPDADIPTRSTVVNRMVRDVMRVLWADPQLDGLVENVSAEPITVDREREVEGWAMAEIRIQLRYPYYRSTP